MSTSFYSAIEYKVKGDKTWRLVGIKRPANDEDRQYIERHFGSYEYFARPIGLDHLYNRLLLWYYKKYKPEEIGEKFYKFAQDKEYIPKQAKPISAHMKKFVKVYRTIITKLKMLKGSQAGSMGEYFRNARGLWMHFEWFSCDGRAGWHPNAYGPSSEYENRGIPSDATNTVKTYFSEWRDKNKPKDWDNRTGFYGFTYMTLSELSVLSEKMRDRWWGDVMEYHKKLAKIEYDVPWKILDDKLDALLKGKPYKAKKTKKKEVEDEDSYSEAELNDILHTLKTEEVWDWVGAEAAIAETWTRLKCATGYDEWDVEDARLIMCWS